MQHKPLKLVNQIIYLGSNISSTESDLSIYLAKAWNAMDSLLVLWKSDISDKIKQDFFQAVAVFIISYGCTTLTLTKYKEEKLDGDYTRMIRAVLNKLWKKKSPQNCTCTDTYLPSHKLFELGEPEMWVTCGEARLDSLARLDSWMCHWCPTRKVLLTSALKGEKMNRRRPVMSGGQERVRELSAASATRWWWLSYWYHY